MRRQPQKILNIQVHVSLVYVWEYIYIHLKKGLKELFIVQPESCVCVLFSAFTISDRPRQSGARSHGSWVQLFGARFKAGEVRSWVQLFVENFGQSSIYLVMGSAEGTQ